MKILRIFLILACCGYVYANEDMQKIYEQASQIVENNHSEKEDEELLFEFYSNQVAKTDLETLKKNPELMFRKALAWFEVIGSAESIQEIINQLIPLQNDFKFVMDHSEQKSRLFTAAQFRYNFINDILKASPKNIEELVTAVLLIQERSLKQWATNPSATGKELREEIFFNVQQDPKIATSFFDYILLSEDDPNIILGYIQPDEIKVVGLVPDENVGAFLLCRVEYRKQNSTITIDIEL